MTALLDDFPKFKRGVDALEAELQQIKGAIRHLTTEMKRDFKVSTVEKAERLIGKMLKKELQLVNGHLTYRKKYLSELKKVKTCPPKMRAIIDELLKDSALNTSKPETPSGRNPDLYAGPDASGKLPRRLKPTSRKSPKRSSKRSTAKSPPW
jgi:hypothetical protein